jgi:hypothetical protein
VRAAIIAVLLVFFLLVGSFGLPRGIEECESKTDSEKITCYHYVAISLIYSSRNNVALRDFAVITCHRIVDEVGSSYPGTDIERRAYIERNNCLYDVARGAAIVGWSYGDAIGICDGIEGKRTGWGFFDAGGSGADTTKEMCIRQVESLSNLNPKNYHDNGICVLVLILPLILISAISKKR